MINIVLEVGTNNSKIGYAGQSRPRISTQSLLIDLQQNKNYSLEEDQLFMHRHNRQLAYKFDFSRKDAAFHDIFEKTWQQEDKQLGLTNCNIKAENYCKFVGQMLAQVREGSNSEFGVLILESPNMKKHQINHSRQTICQYLFNQANVNSVYFLKTSVANALAQGSPNGIVIDSGQNYTSIARIQDAYQQSVVSLNFGGNFISSDIQKIINNKGLGSSLTSYEPGDHFNRLIRLRQFRDIKQKLSKQGGEIQSERVVEVELPDKHKISIDKQLIVDPLTRVNQFKEKNDFYLPSNYRGVPHIVAEFLEESKEKFKESLSKYITFAGGNYLYRDLLERTEANIIKSAAVRGINDVEFIHNNQKLFSSWIGGSIVSSLSSFAPYWVTNREWRENGLSIVTKKCP